MKRIGCGGILVKDTFCGPFPTLPRPGELVAVDSVKTRAGGCAANVAIDLGKQNLSVDLVGCLGRDAAGETLVKSLQTAGVTCDRLTYTTDYPTSETIILLVEGEDRRYIHAFGANRAFSVYHIDGDWLAGLDLFYLGGLFAMPGIQLDELLTLLQFCREHNVVTVVDVVLPRGFVYAPEVQKLLPYIDWFLPNNVEAAVLTGRNDPWEAMQVLRSWGANGLAITLGERGALGVWRDECWHCGTYAWQTVDPSGAGDAFASGLIAGIARGWDFARSLRYASALGASATRAIGTTDGVLSADEAERLIDEQPVAMTDRRSGQDLRRMNLRMPDLSTTGSPIKVVRWLVTVGDFVERGQAVLEVETDKATMEVEALNSGTLLTQLVPEGGEASAGEVLAVIGEAGSDFAPAVSGSDHGTSQTELDRDFLLSLYERMLLIRRFEDRVKALFLEGAMPGTIHQCQGQEATAVGVCAALKPNDFITSTFRGHGHALAKGLTVQEMLDELFGAATGCCKGKGGSMHVGNLDKGMVPGIAIVAGGIPVATGMALAFKLRKTQQVVACFFGDGAVAEGAFHEALNMAALWSLPVLFVCENNLYGASTRIDEVMKNTQVSDRATGYGFRGETIDGNDVLAVYAAALKATDECRAGQGPVLLELLTYRRTGHSRRDPCHYQPKEERSAWAAKDPIIRFAEALLAGGDVDQAELDQIKARVDDEIERAVKKARIAPPPVLADLLTDVYATAKVVS